MTTIGWHTDITRSMLCSMTRNVTPRWLSRTMRSTSVSSNTGLTPAAGSSSRISFGSAISTRASSRSFCCPPESRPAISPALPARSQSSSISMARSRARRSSRRTRPARAQLFQNRSPAWRGGTSMRFSSTVICGNGRGTWNVRASPFAKIRSGVSRSMRPPMKRIAPASGASDRRAPEASRRDNRQHDEDGEHEQLGDHEGQFRLLGCQGVERWNLEKGLDDADKDVEVEREGRTDHVDPSPDPSQMKAIERDDRNREDHQGRDAHDVRGQQVIDREAESGETRGDRGHQKQCGPAAELPPCQEADHDDESRADPDQAQHDMNRRERPERHSPNYGPLLGSLVRSPAARQSPRTRFRNRRMSSGT